MCAVLLCTIYFALFCALYSALYCVNTGSSSAQPILASPAQPSHHSLVSTERSDPLCGSTSDIRDKYGHE